MPDNWNILKNNKQKYINVCDYISGMTDNYAINTHRKFLIYIVLMLFYEYLKKEIFEIVKKLLEEQNLDSDLKNNSFNIELSQKVNFGDLSSNVALVFQNFNHLKN